jgi:uncharacterized heparinase superfamily protein
LVFEGAEASGWLKTGLAILRDQLPEQVLSDGGQFERSPMYHALALEDLLDLINAAQAARLAELDDETARWREVAGCMLHWLRVMTHPDGRLGRFNDSADGIAPSNAELERYAAALGVTSDAPTPDEPVHLAESGYVRVAWADALALLDVAPVGPDYLPGHAHADTLSFELSVYGQLLVVNGGTSCYGQSARRLQERGTAAHSTVQVGGYNSSEVWSGFRVGRRARLMGLQVSANPMATAEVRVSHDGYRWLPGKPLHTRAWRFTPGGLEVEDQVSATTLPSVARYHLAPGLTLQAESPQVWLVRHAGATLARVQVLRGKASDEPSSFAPEFGQVLATRCLAVRCDTGGALTQWAWGSSAAAT